MVANFGYGALLLSLIVSLYGIVVSLLGVSRKNVALIESARRAMLLIFPLITLVAFSIIYLLVSGHYEVAYVYNVTSDSMPLYLKVTALWGGQAGSLIFWSWLMAAFASAVTLRKWDRDHEFLPWVILVSLVTLAFFLALSVFFENPFETMWLKPDGSVVQAMFQPAGTMAATPVDGRGLNPLLRHPGMVIHPPMLYLGFVSFVIPFAFAVAALVTGRTDDRWIRLTRRWTLVAWLFLSLGLVLGSRWAYDVLGWGGYWAWDPVEIAAFMPWLSGTAFLHSVMIQEKRGLFKRWNMILVVLTYALVIFGTFLTRSGVLSSVHSFSQSAIGPMFFGFIALTFVISVALLIWRWGDLRAEGEMKSLLSRESLFLVNNLLFMSILVICFTGVVYPIISEVFTGQKVTVGPSFYESATGPLFAVLVLLMGIAPLSAWGHSTGKTLGRALWKPALASLAVPVLCVALGMREALAIVALWICGLTAFITFYEYARAVAARSRATGEALPVSLWNLAGRNRRRYGGYIIHVGVVLMALGIIGIEFLQTETQATLVEGGQLHLDGYTVTLQGLDMFTTNDNRDVARATLDITRGDSNLGQLFPRYDVFLDSQQPATIPGVRSTLESDLYTLLVGWDPAGVTIKVYHNPLVNWLWIGSLVFILGTMVAAWPDRDPEAEKARHAQRARAAARA